MHHSLGKEKVGSDFCLTNRGVWEVDNTLGLSVMNGSFYHKQVFLNVSFSLSSDGRLIGLSKFVGLFFCHKPDFLKSWVVQTISYVELL